MKLLTFDKIFFRFVLLVYILALVNRGFAQGTNGLFIEGGAGARALALGNAYVAIADDPSAVFWNPAGLDFIEKRSAMFYYTNGIAGTNYSFVGLVYPTLSIGGIGFGWLRIATGDVVPRDENGIPEPAQDYSQNQFLFSYAKQVKSYLSLGLSLKIETLSQIGNLSDSGVGVDFGVLYRPTFDSALLRDVSVGINVQNLVAPTMKLVNRADSSPLNLKVGLAKAIRFGEERNSALTFLWDLNKSENAASKLSFGAEYSFHDRANVRFGMNDGQMTFGAGASYSSFRFDYTFGKLFDGVDFSGNHRFSLTLEIGKSKSELIEIARKRQAREFQISIDNRLWFENETDFNGRMEEGRNKYYNHDYFGAHADFSAAADAAENLVEIAMRFRGENMEDLEANLRVETANAAIVEAEQMRKLADAKSDSLTNETIRRVAREAAQSRLEQELQEFVLKRRQKGDAFFKGGFFGQAIREWQEALERLSQTDNGASPKWAPEVMAGLKNSIEAAQEQLQGNVAEAIKRADNLARRGNYVQALNVLNDLIGTGLSSGDLKAVNAKKRRFQEQLTYQQNFDKGKNYYENKDWKSAMSAFERVLKIRPNDVKARQYLEDAKARSLAKLEPLPPELRIKNSRAHKLYRQGKYKEALVIWEEILKERPYNKRILDAIDRAREKLR